MCFGRRVRGLPGGGRGDAGQVHPLYFGKCRFRWLKIWQDGALVRSFRPVMLENGLAALWDSVSERVFWPNTPFCALGPVTRKFNSSTVITVR